MTLDWIAIGKLAIKNAKPMVSVLFLLKNIASSRKGEYDSSIKANIETYRSLILPSEGYFSSFKSKFVRRIFFDDEVNTDKCFERLNLIDTEQILDLVKIYISGKSFEHSELYNDVKRKFYEDSGLDDNISGKFIRCLCGYFSVFVCSSSKNRDLLSISILSDRIEEKVNTSTSFAEMQTVCSSCSATSVSECMDSHFRERFIEVILNVSASKIMFLDHKYLNDNFYKNKLADCVVPSSEMRNPSEQAYLKYLQEVGFWSFKDDINDALDLCKMSPEGAVKEGDKAHFYKEIAFCLALKFISECEEFKLSSQNIYNVNASFALKCRTVAKHEVEIIISTVTMSVPDPTNPCSKVISIGEVGMGLENMSREYLDELGLGLGISSAVPRETYDYFNEHCPKELCVSMFGSNDTVFSDEIIKQELKSSSKRKQPRYYYIMLEEEVHGIEIMSHLSSRFQPVRFILRSESQDALRLLNIDYFTAALGSIKTTCEIQ
ncbi:hypothetical protein [Maridesulfovibrio sp.]|uniref:hypothetical protein n=1 Tax=Maridesulfovibrio sp. TaxID=2795000 RepID=UPI002A18E3A5|nr:hypothetical protein [Maridesulfovibrio sp.]